MKIFVGCSCNNDKEYLEENKKLLELISQENDLIFDTCNKEIITNSVLEKTKIIFKESDLLLFLPGDIETYFEIFSAIESKRCHKFNNPIIIFNSNGFFDKFKETMDNRFSNYVVVDTIQEIINYCENYKKTQETTNYKEIYEYGLYLFKDSLSEINERPYSTILPYFTYPLSIIETTVKKAKNSKIDTNEFYKEQCDELLKMYNRFLTTCLVCKSQMGTKEEKKRANKILEAIKNEPNIQKEELNKEETIQHIENSKHSKEIILSKFKKRK